MRVRARSLAVAGMTAIAMATGVAMAASGNGDVPVPDLPPNSPMSLVESYSYPGADAIYDEYGVRLIEGDGNIVLAECGSKPDLVAISSSKLNPPHLDVCFDVRGDGSYLRLKLPQVYGIAADNHAIKATITVDNQTDTVDVPANERRGVGVGDGDSNTGEATLLELRATS